MIRTETDKIQSLIATLQTTNLFLLNFSYSNNFRWTKISDS